MRRFRRFLIWAGFIDDTRYMVTFWPDSVKWGKHIDMAPRWEFTGEHSNGKHVTNEKELHTS